MMLTVSRKTATTAWVSRRAPSRRTPTAPGTANMRTARRARQPARPATVGYQGFCLSYGSCNPDASHEWRAAGDSANLPPAHPRHPYLQRSTLHTSVRAVQPAAGWCTSLPSCGRSRAPGRCRLTSLCWGGACPAAAAAHAAAVADAIAATVQVAYTGGGPATGTMSS